MLSDLFKAAASKRSISDMAYGDTDPGIIPAPATTPMPPAMPAITINIVIGEAKKKKHKKEEEELLEDVEEEDL